MPTSSALTGRAGSAPRLVSLTAVSAPGRTATATATATAVSVAPSTAGSPVPPGAFERTTIRCGVSAAGLPGWLSPSGLPPEPVDIAVESLLGGRSRRVKRRVVPHPAPHPPTCGDRRPANHVRGAHGTVL